jgi:hypothetical protein
VPPSFPEAFKKYCRHNPHDNLPAPPFLSRLCRDANAGCHRGPIEPDETGNAVHNVYIKKVERVGGELQNTVIYTYPKVSQFRPPCRYCQ